MDQVHTTRWDLPHACLIASLMTSALVLDGCGGGGAGGETKTQQATLPSDSGVSNSNNTTVRAVVPAQVQLVLANPNLDLSVSASFEPGSPQETVVQLSGLQFDVITGEFVGQALAGIPAMATSVQLSYLVNDPAYGTVLLAATNGAVPVSSVLSNGVMNFNSVPVVLADNDHDSFSNLAEILAGTNPNNASVFPPPAPPVSISVKLDTNSTVISWPSSTGATAYRVYLAFAPLESAGPALVSDWQIIDTESTTLTIAALTNANVAAVFVRVAGVNDAGEGDLSPFGSSDPNRTPPALSEVLQVNDVGIQNVSLSNATPADASTNASLNTRVSAIFTPNAAGEVIMSSWLQLLHGNAVPVIGSQSWARVGNAMTVTFIPDVALDPNTKYTVLVRTGTSIASGPIIDSWSTFGFLTGASTNASIDTTPPVLQSVTPARSSTNVLPSSPVELTFSEPVMLNSVSSGVFISDGNALVRGVWSANGNTVKFDSGVAGNSVLQPNTGYTVTINGTILDLALNAMAPVNFWTFNTGSVAPPADTTAPTVTSTDPAKNAVAVPRTKPITVVFSEPVSATALQSYGVVTAGAVNVLGAWKLNGNIATFTSAASLTPATVYQLRLAAALTDLAGNTLGTDYVVNFTTESVAPPADTIPPTIVRVSPRAGSTSVSLTTRVSVTFSEAVSLLSLQGNSSVSAVVPGSPAASLPVAGSWSVRGAVATFRPTVPLKASTHYEVKIGANVVDLAGNPIGVATTSGFDTRV